MYHNINAGRLRHYVELERLSTDTDDYGQPIGFEPVFDARAHVRTVKGSELVEYGTTTTQSQISVLLWYDERATDDMELMWNNIRYQVKHVRPDDYFKSMILTCEVIKK